MLHTLQTIVSRPFSLWRLINCLELQVLRRVKNHLSFLSLFLIGHLRHEKQMTNMNRSLIDFVVIRDFKICLNLIYSLLLSDKTLSLVSGLGSSSSPPSDVSLQMNDMIRRSCRLLLLDELMMFSFVDHNRMLWSIRSPDNRTNHAAQV